MKGDDELVEATTTTHEPLIYGWKRGGDHLWPAAGVGGGRPDDAARAARVCAVCAHSSAAPSRHRRLIVPHQQPIWPTRGRVLLVGSRQTPGAPSPVVRSSSPSSRQFISGKI